MRRPSDRDRLGTCWLVGGLLLAACCFWNAFPHSGLSGTTSRDPTIREFGYSYASKRIEQIRVGEHVLAHNPLREQVGNHAPIPHPATWRRIGLVMESRDGAKTEIELLRPLAWTTEHAPRAGVAVDLDLPEMHICGRAKVLFIRGCPLISNDPGYVVTGTFTRTVDSTYEVQVEGLSDPIGVTATHPFWSDDRHAFIPAGELSVGERLRLVDKRPARVLSVTARNHPTRVYNLEVNNEHVYYVSALGILVHNVCFYQSGTYGELVAASEPFDGLEIHHVPQAHPAEQVIPGYERRTGTAIAIPEDIHRVIPRIRGPYAGTPQELIALGLRQLEASVPAEDIAILAARIHDTYDLP